MLARWGIASQSYALGFLAEQRVARGAVAEARALLPAPGGWPELSDGTLIVLRAEIEILLAEGRPAEALARAEELADGAWSGAGCATSTPPGSRGAR